MRLLKFFRIWLLIVPKIWGITTGSYIHIVFFSTTGKETKAFAKKEFGVLDSKIKRHLKKQQKSQ